MGKSLVSCFFDSQCTCVVLYMVPRYSAAFLLVVHASFTETKCHGTVSPIHHHIAHPRSSSSVAVRGEGKRVGWIAAGAADTVMTPTEDAATRDCSIGGSVIFVNEN